jgi:hypothetical protein
VINWLSKGGLLQLQATAIQQPSYLLVNAHGLTISNDIDFGMQQVVAGCQEGQPRQKGSASSKLNPASSYDSRTSQGKPLNGYLNGYPNSYGYSSVDHTGGQAGGRAEGGLQLPLTLRGAVARGEVLLRELTITNSGSSAIWLVNIWVVGTFEKITLH